MIQNKLYDTEFLNMILGNDIVGLSELHTLGDVSMPGFKLVKQKIRKEIYKRPKISGGVAVFVQNKYEGLVHLIPNENEDSIRIKIKSSNKFKDDILYRHLLYMP